MSWWSERKEKMQTEKRQREDTKQKEYASDVEEEYRLAHGVNKKTGEKFKPSYSVKKEEYEKAKFDREQASHKRAKERETIRQEQEDLKHPYLKKTLQAGERIATAGSVAYGTTDRYVKERAPRMSRRGKRPERERAEPKSYSYGGGYNEGASGLSSMISQELSQPQQRQYSRPPESKPLDFFGAPKQIDYFGSKDKPIKTDYIGNGKNKKVRFY